MASITSIQPPTAQDLGNGSWKLSVKYRAKFSNYEVNNFEFRDSIQVWESDLLNDDQITSWKDYNHFDPSSNVVERTKSTTVSDDSLDTEAGTEEVYLKIRLENLDLGTTPITENSSQIKIDP